MPNFRTTDQLKIISDNINAVVYEFYQDIEGHFQVSYMSEGTIDLFNLEAESIYANINLIFDLVYDEDKDALFQSIRKSYELNKNWFHDYRIIVNGKLKWVSGRSKIHKLDDGSCRWFGVVMDVTQQYELKEKKEIQDNLIKEQRNELDSILAVISPLIKVKLNHDGTSELISINVSAKNLFPFLSHLNNPFDQLFSFIHSNDRRIYKKKLNDGIFSQKPFSFTFRMVIDQNIRYLMLSAIAIKHSDDIVFFGMYYDITNEKELDQENERLSKELAQLIDTANAPIFGIDTYGKINEWNQKAVEITGFSKSEVYSQHLVNTYISDAQKSSVSQILHSALSGDETSNYELPIYTKSGDRVIVLLNATTRRNINGDIIGVIGVGQDITEMNKIKIKTDQLNVALLSSREEERKAVSRFVHDEICQQLAFLKISLDLIKSKNKLNNQICDFIVSSESCVKSLIDSSRQISKNLSSPQLHVLGLKNAIEDYISRLTLINDKIRIKADFYGYFNELSDSVVEVLYRVAQESLNNCIKHSSADFVSLTLSCSRSLVVELTIKDNGLGFSSDDLKKDGSMGIIGMKERIFLANGTFEIKNLNRGTVIKVKLNDSY